jgi:hypothetical protein
MLFSYLTHPPLCVPAGQELTMAPVYSAKNQKFCFEAPLGTPSCTPGAPLTISKCNGKTYQEFTYTQDRYLLSVSCSLCLDAGDGSEHAPATLRNCTSNSTSQLWSWDDSSENRGAGAMRPDINPNNCLDIPNGDMKEGNQLQIYPCHGASNQLWRADHVINGPSKSPSKGPMWLYW